MVKTLTASAKNPSPCCRGHLDGTGRLWQGEEVAAGCFGCPFGAVGILEGSLHPVVYAPGADSHQGAWGTPVSPSLAGHRQAGDGGDNGIAARGGRAAGAMHRERVAVL